MSLPLPTGIALIPDVRAFGEERGEEGKEEELCDLAKVMPQALVAL